VYGVESIRSLCAEISEAKDEKRIDELVSLLRSMFSDELEEARTRAAFLRQKYPSISDSKAGD